jgi:prefoldin subunit 5
MKRVEITYTSKTKELEKLETRLARQKAKLEKVQAKAEALGVADMDIAAHRAWLENVPKNGYTIANKEDVNKNGAWFDLYSAKRDVEETEQAITRAVARLNKAEQELTEYRAEVEKLDNAKKKEELRRMAFEQAVKEWAKDGIILEGCYYGKTPGGLYWEIDKNNGWTERSLHCYTLKVGGQTVFTSGEFWRAYMEIKKR